MPSQREQETVRDFVENFSLSAEEVERALDQVLPKIGSIETRWLHLKTEDVAGSLDEILLFTRRSEAPWKKEKKLYIEVDMIISTLRTRDESTIYIKVVKVIERYLRSMREFLSRKYDKWVTFYKSLFDAHMIAIVREVKMLEIEMSSS
jgi:hypothetical protein